MEAKRRVPATRVRTWSKRRSLERKRSSTACKPARSASSIDLSISPSTERFTSENASRKMCSATTMPITGSSQSQPVSGTSITATITPTEVQTSVSRCRASASMTIERRRRAPRNIHSATPRLITVAAAEIAAPSGTSLMGCGWVRRLAASIRMSAAATPMSRPSTPLEKYSALV